MFLWSPLTNGAHFCLISNLQQILSTNINAWNKHLIIKRLLRNRKGLCRRHLQVHQDGCDHQQAAEERRRPLQTTLPGSSRRMWSSRRCWGMEKAFADDTSRFIKTHVIIKTLLRNGEGLCRRHFQVLKDSEPDLPDRSRSVGGVSYKRNFEFFLLTCRPTTVENLKRRLGDANNPCLFTSAYTCLTRIIPACSSSIQMKTKANSKSIYCQTVCKIIYWEQINKFSKIVTQVRFNLNVISIELIAICFNNENS